jgi:tRNA dimethylallyltransferase
MIKAILVAEQKEEETKKKDDIDYLVIGLIEDRDAIKQRIRNRLRFRLENGMIEEAEELLKAGIGHEKLHFFGLEYKFLSQYLTGDLKFNDMYQKLASAIIQYSKRQMTWFRKMEKEGIEIHWLRNSDFNKAKELIQYFIQEDVPS